VENRLESGFHRVKIDVAEARGVPALQADLTFQQDLQAVQPLVTILRVSENRPLYTHKTVCPASGELRVGGLRVELDAARDLALVDIQKTYYPLVTEWRWASCAGYDAEGRLIALNLVRNMLPDRETNNENVLWVDGRLSGWGAANFTFDVERVTAPWHIETSDGRCSLEMRPVAERAGRTNLGVLLSDYHAPVGTFSGTVTDDQGAAYEIRDFFGIAEYHRARF
jgi:hypothetical protein